MESGAKREEKATKKKKRKKHPSQATSQQQWYRTARHGTNIHTYIHTYILTYTHAQHARKIKGTRPTPPPLPRFSVHLSRPCALHAVALELRDWSLFCNSYLTFYRSTDSNKNNRHPRRTRLILNTHTHMVVTSIPSHGYCTTRPP